MNARGLKTLLLALQSLQSSLEKMEAIARRASLSALISVAGEMAEVHASSPEA